MTGAVKYNAEQTLTVAQKEQAQKNIGVTYPCNPNLLDNWYFGNPVNQRGQTSYSNNTAAAVYTGDRWTVCRGNVNVNDGYVSLTNDSATTGGNAWFDQTFENSAQLQGKTLTGSALLTDGTLCSGFAVMPNVSSSGQYPTVRIYTSANIVISMQTSSESGKSIMRISTVDTSTSILAVKLELGTQQTLAHQDADGNWVLNEIPDYGEQLARCQRYLRPIVDSEWSDVNIEARYSAASQQIETKLDMRCAPMRTTPVLTIAANDNNSVLRVVAYSPTGTLISPLYVTSAQVSLSANTTSATYADLRITNPFDTASFSEVSIDGYGIITKVFLSAEL